MTQFSLLKQTSDDDGDDDDDADDEMTATGLKLIDGKLRANLLQLEAQFCEFK